MLLGLLLRLLRLAGQLLLLLSGPFELLLRGLRLGRLLLFQFASQLLRRLGSLLQRLLGLGGTLSLVERREFNRCSMTLQSNLG